MGLLYKVGKAYRWGRCTVLNVHFYIPFGYEFMEFLKNCHEISLPENHPADTRR